MAAPICPACGTAARLTDGAEIYPHRPDLEALAERGERPTQATTEAA